MINAKREKRIKMEMIEDLQETIYAMTSDDYKQRFVAEYVQVVIRANKLNDIINRYFNDALDFKLECGIWLLVEQYMVMKHYIEILQKRAEIENIDLTTIEIGPEDEDDEKL